MSRSYEKIDQLDFVNLDGVSFNVSMTKHLNSHISEDKSLIAICEVITNAFHEHSHICARFVGNHHVAQISFQNELYSYLDPEIRDEFLNWLIFKREGNSITIIHFGPFQSEQEDIFENIMCKTDRAIVILRNLSNELDCFENEISESEDDITPEDIQEEVLAKYWGQTNDYELKMDSKRKDLEDLSNSIYDKPEDKAAARELIGKIKASTGKVVVKALTAAVCEEMIEQIVTKIAANVAAKTASKGMGKAAGKAVPFAGAVVCVGFGIWRLSRGDITGAGLEFVSGAVSCVPGSGTAASLAIDAVLVTKDIAGARNEGNKTLEDVKAEMERIGKELNYLSQQYDNAKEAYDFVEDILEDEGFKFVTLQHEIQILEMFSTTLHKI